MIFSIYFYVKIEPPLWPHLNPGEHDLNTSKYTLPEDASTQVSTFLA